MCQKGLDTCTMVLLSCVGKTLTMYTFFIMVAGKQCPVED